MYLADLHIHSRYSIATGRQACLEAYHHWARIKGIRVVGSGDFTHPKWMAEIREKLEPLDNGFLRFRSEPAFPGGPEISPAALDVQFCLSAEISSIYKKQGKTRKIHSLIFAPDLETADRIREKLGVLGNIASDGRPILGLGAKQLLELVLEISPRACLVPAHVWTPWFALFGSKSGFDRIEECFEDLTPEIFALETGLSSDPAMNWRWSELDRFALISNSDAHSPANLGREANIFDTALDYDSLFGALRSREGFLGTCEFFPQEGKYHLDGHRACGVRLQPEETRRRQGVCPVCGRQLTVGVLHRVLECADRRESLRPPGAGSFRYHIPLAELLAELCGRGARSRAVGARYAELISAFGSEFGLLYDSPAEELRRCDPLLAEAVARMREGRVELEPGFDGQFGVIRAFRAGELELLRGQSELFGPQAAGAAAHAAGSGGAGPAEEAGAGAPQAGEPGEEAPEAGAPEAKAPEAKAPEAKAPESGLNPRQRELLSSPAPVLRVSAGPGTGKTRLLTVWIADLVRRGEVAPDRVLAVTFTNKAARQLRERLHPLLGAAAREVVVSTFHAFCYALLREADPGLGHIADGHDRSLILGLLEPGLNPGALKRRSRELGRGLEEAAARDAGGPDEDDLRRRYRAFLAAAGGVDLAELVTRAVALLDRNPELAAALRGRYQVVAVDEFQDINPAQYRLLTLLFPPPAPAGGEAAAGRRLLAIGDPNQSIYAFRGSEAGLFERFGADFRAREVTLTWSYRCPAAVLRAAHELIARNSRPPGAPLEAVSRRDSLIRRLSLPSTREEGRYIAAEVERLVGGTRQLSVTAGREDGYSFADIAVLTRTHQVAQALLPYLRGAGIPVSIGRHASLLSEPPLAVLRSALRLLADPGNAAAFLDLLAGRPDLYPPASARALCRAALSDPERAGRTAAELFAALAAEGRESLRDGQRAGLADLAELLRRAQELLASRGVAAALELLAERLLPRKLAADPGADPAPGLAQLGELAGECGADLAAFLRRVELSVFESEGAFRPERVSLLTFHAAKGLEFPVVFIAGAEETITPITTRGADLEEERRLFYVALTRARERVIITCSRARRRYGQPRAMQPSRFLAEIPASCLQGGAGEEIGPARDSGQLSLFS
jgi:DNA helicase-2/ATP-dependent DNA helicase PcrA